MGLGTTRCSINCLWNFYLTFLLLVQTSFRYSPKVCQAGLFVPVGFSCPLEFNPFDFKSQLYCWLIGKDSDAGRDWGQEEKGTTEDEMAGWHHWLDGRASEWTPGVGEGQGGLACCNSWGCKESDTTEQLIWSDLILLSNSILPLALYFSSSFPLKHTRIAFPFFY